MRMERTSGIYESFMEDFLQRYMFKDFQKYLKPLEACATFQFCTPKKYEKYVLTKIVPLLMTILEYPGKLILKLCTEPFSQKN